MKIRPAFSDSEFCLGMKIFLKTFTLILFSAISITAAAQAITPEHQRRAEALTAQMTLEEKLDYIGGYNEFHIRPVPRLGIPEIRMADGPQGVRNDTKSTLYPCGVAAAATWNRELVRQMGISLGRDSRARGVHILLGPGVNIYRMPLCGRNFEYMGEDPYLSSRMAVEYIRGVQSQGVMATVKHFACNNEEYDRHHVSSEVDERTLNEIYFPAFKAAVKEAGVGSVMTSYNLLNGVHTAQSPYLIGQTLRRDWGFRGIVMSDWTSVYSPLQAAVSGIDLEMPDGFCLNREKLLPLIESGAVTEAQIDAKVTAILRTLIAFGFLDRPQKDTSIPEDNPSSDETSLAVASESIVMLENHGALPLAGHQDIVLMGPYSTVVPCGGGSGSVEPIRTVSLYDGLKAVPGFDVTYIPMQENSEDRLCKARNGAEDRLRPIPGGSEDLIRNASAVILSLGFDKTTEKENSDRSFSLPEDQLRLIDKACELNDNVIVIVCAGGSVEVANWKDKVSALLWGWYYGQQGGTALAKIISGEISPSGRLPMSFETRLEDNPCYGSYYPDAPHMKRADKDGRIVTYKEGIFVGYRGYDRSGTAPLYPFGYGLTYGDFEYSDFAVKQDGDNVRLSFTLRNEGKHTASEVVQVYVGQQNPSVPRPLRELKQFSKVSLAPGESRKISLGMSRYAFSHYDVATHSWKADSDTYTVSVGASERDIRLSSDIEYVNADDRKNLGVKYVDAKSLGIYGHPAEGCGTLLSRVAPSFDFGDAGINEYAAQSTGLFLHFRTDSPVIRARWTTSCKNAGVNMSAIGQKGLDLYILRDGRWVFAGVGTPCMTGDFSRHESTIVADMTSEMKECLLYLPIYDRTCSLELGFSEGSSLEALPNPFGKKVVCVGSSITHGAAASRAGMTWPAQLSRSTGWYCPNMGFSGKSKLDRSYAEFLATVTADAFVFDAFSNPDATMIYERFDAFVDIIRAAHPDTPLIFLNTERRETRNFSRTKEAFESAKQAAAREVVRKRMKTDRNMYFIDCTDFLGSDSIATADGTHPTDLGFSRMLVAIERPLRKLLK